jgi:hypothetical protein
MSRLQRTGRAVAAVLLVLVIPALPIAAPGGSIDSETAPRALASNGAVVVMPAIAQLDCDGMAKVLHLLDRSNYRGAEPVPEGSPDRPIFEYEDRLARAYYQRCILSAARLADPAPAFSSGFQTTE